MPINPDAVGTTSDPVERSWTSTDALLYALAVGAGSLDATGFELEYTTENSADTPQRVLPTFATVVGGAGASLARVGRFDPAMLVHGEQAIELFGPLPVEGTVRTTSTVEGVYDKGSGALVVSRSTSVDAGTGAPLFCATTSLFVRGEGGFGGARGPSTAPPPMPEGRPDEIVSYTTRPDQALLYRLCGDRNPLHSDPVFAKRAGFDRPILHGLCTYGFTGRALLHTVCGSDPSRMRSLAGRFSRPALPGDTLTVSMWDRGDAVRFRTDTQRGETVIDAGILVLA
ncbi:MAG TPA: MaoC/PaaZ C-terminal domain-containing protein [Acidimicrobiales bacterium]|nr:MaoC/PaaZ C-terminal domain-containing protein [Acidimicrobiales bacterium]